MVASTRRPARAEVEIDDKEMLQKTNSIVGRKRRAWLFEMKARKYEEAASEGALK